MKFFLLFCVSAFYLLADAHIFIYHRFNDDRYPSTNTPNDALKKQFSYLKDNNYTVVPLGAIVQKLNDNETVPDKWVALTIDDGYKSFLNALPIFEEFGYPFTMFVYAEAAEKKYPDFLSWEQLKSLTEHNGSLEFHSYAHPHSTRLGAEKLKADFEKGLELFKTKLEITPQFYSYPYGELDDKTLSIAKEFGFSAIFNQNSGAVDSTSSVYDLNRLAVVGKADIKQLLKHQVLEAEWIEPKIFPKNSNLTKIEVSLNSDEKNAQLYITDIGWRGVEVKNGTVNAQINKKLTSQRTRLILKIGDKTSTKILVKD